VMDSPLEGLKKIRFLLTTYVSSEQEFRLRCLCGQFECFAAETQRALRTIFHCFSV
jgi:hypothetical protein